MIQLVTSSPEQANSLSNSLSIGSRWRGLEITHVELDEAIDRLLKFWWEGFSPGLILAGNTGCAKTSLAELVLGWAMGRRYQAEMISEPDLLAEIRKRFSDSTSDGYIQWLNWQDLLIIDDVGAGNVSKIEWYHDILWRLLNGRERHGRKTVLTTNLLPAQLDERVGDRASSRLRDIIEPGYFVSMFGIPDYRRERHNRKKAELAAWV